MFAGRCTLVGISAHKGSRFSLTRYHGTTLLDPQPNNYSGTFLETCELLRIARIMEVVSVYFIAEHVLHQYSQFDSNGLTNPGTRQDTQELLCEIE